MHECIKKLLGNVDNPEEEEIESLCKLLAAVRSMLDIQKARGHLDVYFSRNEGVHEEPERHSLNAVHAPGGSLVISSYHPSNLICFRICSSSANVSGLHLCRYFSRLNGI